MRPGSELSVTEWCTDDVHRRCPHWWSAPGEPKVDQEIVRLCQCSCHESCPLAVSATVHVSSWETECDCRGASAAKAGSGDRRGGAAR